MSWGFGVPEMEVVCSVNEIGDSMDDLSLHFLYKKDAAQPPSIFLIVIIIVVEFMDFL